MFGATRPVRRKCSIATRCANVLAVDVTHACVLTISSQSGAGAIVQPMRMPVSAFDFESELIAIVYG